MKIIFLGAPGAGKGTQAAEVSRKYGIPTISTGNMIREAIANGSPIGLAAKEKMANGQLLDDGTVIEIVREKLKTVQGGYILDGFPRTIAQAEALEEMGEEIDAVLNIYVPDDTISFITQAYLRLFGFLQRARLQIELEKFNLLMQVSVT